MLFLFHTHVQITKKDVDTFGKDEPASCDITIQAKSDAVDYLSYEIRLNGIDSDVNSLYINVSLGTCVLYCYLTCEKFNNHYTTLKAIAVKALLSMR